MLAKGHLEGLGSVQDHLLLGLGHVAPARVDIEVVGLANRVHDVEGDLAINRVPALERGHERAIAQGLGLVGHEQARVHAVFNAKPTATLAGTQRMIEAEVATGQVLSPGINRHASEVQSQEIERSRHRAHGGARVGRCSSLADGDGRGQATDLPGRRSPQLAEVLPCPG